MTRTRDSTHVDTVGEKYGKVVLTWLLPGTRDRSSMMDRAGGRPSR
jgi:hypothetical protein